MFRHKGGHFRIGVVDVIPFIPLVGVSIDECVSLANKVGEILEDKLDLTVYMYGVAVKRPELNDLGYVQNIQYKGLGERINK